MVVLVSHNEHNTQWWSWWAQWHGRENYIMLLIDIILLLWQQTMGEGTSVEGDCRLWNNRKRLRNWHDLITSLLQQPTMLCQSSWSTPESYVPVIHVFISGTSASKLGSGGLSTAHFVVWWWNTRYAWYAFLRLARSAGSSNNSHDKVIFWPTSTSNACRLFMSINGGCKES